MPEAVREAQDYTWQTLHKAYRPGMGHLLPDRLFTRGSGSGGRRGGAAARRRFAKQSLTPWRFAYCRCGNQRSLTRFNTPLIPETSDHEPQRRALRARAAHDSRRRQFAGPRVPLRRRHAAFFHARSGPVSVGRRRQALHRLRRLVGTGDPRPRAPGRRERRERNGAERVVIRRADRDRDRAGRDALTALPSIEMVRLVSSGTEATMSALRLARGYTGRNKIVKFEGCYHGHADACW